MRHLHLCVLSLALLGVAGGALAQDLPDAQAVEKLLYQTGPRATAVAVTNAEVISPAEAEGLKALNAQLPYYSAVAISPDEGLQSTSVAITAGFHDGESAARAAIEACNKARKRESKPCLVVAYVLPRGYDGVRAVMMSTSATDAFRDSYKRAPAPKAFALSAATGKWGAATAAGSGEAARADALASCTNAGGTDCRVVTAE